MLNDPELDALLDESRSITDIDARQEVLNQIQQMVVEQAYVLPLFASDTYYAVSNRWQNVVFNPALLVVDISGATITE